MNATLLKEIEGLARMTVTQLRQKYVDAFGEETRSHNKDFLRKRIAWRLQALACGGLSERARRRAEELANDADLRVRAPRATPRRSTRKGLQRDRQPTRPRRDPRLPPPGELLIREFKGMTIVVRVLEDGFEYEGHLYRSLSPIARKVTGTNWSGFLFFGLNGPARRATDRRDQPKGDSQ